MKKRIIGLFRHNIQIDRIRTPFGEPFDLTNHWVKTLIEYENGIHDFKQSSLYVFHKEFCPKSIFDVLKDGSFLKNYRSHIPLGSYPWGKWTSRIGEEQWKKSCHCGPSDDSLIEKEWNEFIHLYKKIKEEKIDFKTYGNPLGLFLISKENKKYFIVLGGNHRIAIASFLKETIIPVRLLARDYISNQVVKFNQIKKDDIAKKLFNNIISKEFVKYEI